MDCMKIRRRVDQRSVRRPGRMPDAGGSGGEKVLDGEIIRGELGNDLSAIEYQGTMADLRDLLEIRRDDHEGGAGPQGHVEEKINFRFSADINARRRILEDVKLAGKMQPAC